MFRSLIITIISFTGFQLHALDCLSLMGFERTGSIQLENPSDSKSSPGILLTLRSLSEFGGVERTQTFRYDVEQIESLLKMLKEPDQVEKHAYSTFPTQFINTALISDSNGRPVIVVITNKMRVIAFAVNPMESTSKKQKGSIEWISSLNLKRNFRIGPVLLSSAAALTWKPTLSRSGNYIELILDMNHDEPQSLVRVNTSLPERYQIAQIDQVRLEIKLGNSFPQSLIRPTPFLDSKLLSFHVAQNPR